MRYEAYSVHDHIHSCTKEDEEEDNFLSIVSHMEIDCKEKKDPKMTKHYNKNSQ
jgi:hypothetical protein